MYHQQRHSYGLACQKGTSFVRTIGSNTLMTCIWSTYRGKFQLDDFPDFAFLSFYANCMIFLNTCNSGDVSINSPLWSSKTFCSRVTCRSCTCGRLVIFLQVFQCIEKVSCSHTKDGCAFYIDIQCPFLQYVKHFYRKEVSMSQESQKHYCCKPVTTARVYYTMCK